MKKNLLILPLALTLFATAEPLKVSVPQNSLSVYDSSGNPIALTKGRAGVTSVNGYAVWSNAGTVGGAPIDIKATVKSLTSGDILYFYDPSANPSVIQDDLRIDLKDNPDSSTDNTTGTKSVQLQWEVFLAGTSTPANGNIDFSITDIDGKDGLPNSREIINPSLNHLTGYASETPTNIAFAVDDRNNLLNASGTQDQDYELTSMATFSWRGVSSWEVNYQLKTTSNINAAAFLHDGDGDLQFSNANLVKLITLDLDVDDSTATGTAYQNVFNEGSSGSAVSIVDSDVTVTQHRVLGTNLGGATIKLTNAKEGDALNIGTLPEGITATTDTSVDGEITVTLSGVASIADYQTALQNILFNNTSTSHIDTTPRQIEIYVTNNLFGTNTEVAIATINIEADFDNDGLVDSLDQDDDNDGILDSIEGNTDSDGDGHINSLDLDSDNDGIPDNVEVQTTYGYIAPSGTVDLATGIDINYPGGLTPENTDGSDTADYLDSDSDNDGKGDTVEAGYTVTATTTDTDGDGILDAYDDVNGNDVNDELNSGASTLPNGDTIADNDNEVDYRDIDHDSVATVAQEDNVTATTAGSTVTVDVLANDTDAESDINASTVSIITVGATDSDGDGDFDTLVVANEGTWTVDNTTGKITFTPVAGLIGDPTPIQYQVSDNIANVSNAANVSVNYPPVVTITNTTTKADGTVTVNGTTEANATVVSPIRTI
ncbi:MAG: hypothetical protein IE883_06875 [Epsilonproteobacteria bacterium]|nr:hypothetical protein [Campylobacterota bacterium]